MVPPLRSHGEVDFFMPGNAAQTPDAPPTPGRAGATLSSSFEQLNRRFGPWLSLALGIAAVAWFRRGLGFAPSALGVLLLAWMGALALRRLTPAGLPAQGDATPDAARWRRFLIPAGESVVVTLWQNVLFYLLPIWWASAAIGSWNVAVPALLAAMAVFSCFEYRWRAWVLDRPVIHAAWSAVILFATLLPAASLLGAPLRAVLGFSAGVSALAIASTLAPRIATRPVLRVCMIAFATTTAAALAPYCAPLLPPVPVVRMASGAGTAVAERELRGASEVFPGGTPRVYAWFAVAVPGGYRQSVRFEWYHEDTPVGRAVETLVIGGRPEGFRTWSYRTAPAPGHWRVDLRTDSSQLIARQTFVVR
jgi:hypothetical protein